MPGFVFFDGPSLIDGAPVIGIAVLSSVAIVVHGARASRFIPIVAA